MSLRSAGNLHDKASLRGEGRKVGAANVNGRSNVNYLYASQSAAILRMKTRDWRAPAPSSSQITVKFSDESVHFRA